MKAPQTFCILLLFLVTVGCGKAQVDKVLESLNQDSFTTPGVNTANVLENYDTTIYVEEAIHRLVEIYYRIGLTEESSKYAKLLGYNYGSSEWYKESYAIFNKDYVILENKIKKNKSKKGIIKTFKKLFE